MMEIFVNSRITLNPEYSVQNTIKLQQKMDIHDITYETCKEVILFHSKIHNNNKYMCVCLKQILYKTKVFKQYN